MNCVEPSNNIAIQVLSESVCFKEVLETCETAFSILEIVFAHQKPKKKKFSSYKKNAHQKKSLVENGGVGRSLDMVWVWFWCLRCQGETMKGLGEADRMSPGLSLVLGEEMVERKEKKNYGNQKR